jgi:hypothetical protein
VDDRDRGGDVDSRWTVVTRWLHHGRTIAGVGYLVRQTACIGGGTTEMARNVISERLLRMPRAARTDDGPFRAVSRKRRA